MMGSMNIDLISPNHLKYVAKMEGRLIGTISLTGLPDVRRGVWTVFSVIGIFLLNRRYINKLFMNNLNTHHIFE
jgi:hypothetical protein